MWQSRRTICFLTMTSTEHRIQAEAETRSPEGLQQRSKASAGSRGRNGLRAPNLNCENVRVRAATTPEPEPPGSQVLRLAESRRGAEVLPLPAETSREAPKCCAWQHRGGGAPNTLGHTPEPEVLPLPAETSREAQKCCAWQHQRGGPRNALGHRPEPEVLPLPAETSREARKCCAWQHRGGGPRNALGHRQQKRAAKLESAAPGSIEGGGPETRSGTVQSLKCCPCLCVRVSVS